MVMISWLLSTTVGCVFMVTSVLFYHANFGFFWQVSVSIKHDWKEKSDNKL